MRKRGEPNNAQLDSMIDTIPTTVHDLHDDTRSSLLRPWDRWNSTHSRSCGPRLLRPMRRNGSKVVRGLSGWGGLDPRWATVRTCFVGRRWLWYRSGPGGWLEISWGRWAMSNAGLLSSPS